MDRPSLLRGALAAALALLLAAAPARADLTAAQGASRWSLGLLVGDPFGLSLKEYRGGRGYLDVNVAFAYGPGIRGWADLLFPVKRIPSNESAVDFDLYAGFGGLVGVTSRPCGIDWGLDGCSGTPYAGVRGALGFEAQFKRTPLSLGLELGPALVVGGRTSGGVPLGALVDLFFAVRLLL